jgi:peptide/nickel transport system substrate-binding protein
MFDEQERPNVLRLDARSLTRRQLLGLLGLGAGAAALAACGGETAQAPTAGTGGTSGGTAPTAASGGTSSGGAAPTAAGAPGGQQGGGKRGGQFNGAWPYELPPAGHFNAYIPKFIFSGFQGDIIECPPAFYRWADNTYLPVLAEKWGFNGDSFELTLKPGLKWSNGQPLTARDVLAGWTLSRLYNNQLFRYVDRFEAKDDRTVSFHMNNPSTVVERYVLRGRVRAAATYGEWADKLTPLYAEGKANASDEVKAIRGEFEKLRPQEVVASGPYMLDPRSLTEAQMTLVRNPNGWNADVARFDRIVLFNGETPVVTPLVLNKDIDFATHGFPVATDKQMQAQGIRVVRTPIYSGGGIAINYANPKMKAWNDKRVRQAVAHAVKREENATVTLGESGRAVKYMAGFSDNQVERWMSEGDFKKLNQYAYDPKRAEELLQAAGCRKGADGVWVDPDGRRMEYEIIVQAEFQDRSSSVQDWADQMTQFGIKVNVRALTFTQVPIELREGRYELGSETWGAGNPHPHFAFVATLLNKVQPLALGPHTSFNLKQQTDVVGEVDFEQLITATAEGLDINAQKANIGKAALAYNELLPTIPVYERYANAPAGGGTRVAGWPPVGDPIYQNEMYNDSYVNIMIADGRLGPV